MDKVYEIPKDPKELGALGEVFATEYLIAQGYEILARNWRVKEGELDLIAEKDGVAVAVEVKTRRNTILGSPFEAITPKKILKLRTLFAMWLKTKKKFYRGVRIDAIAVVCKPKKPAEIFHLEAIS